MQRRHRRPHLQASAARPGLRRPAPRLAARACAAARLVRLSRPLTRSAGAPRSFNRHYAENSGYWERSTTFLCEEEQTTGEITFYDSVTGKPLFYTPRGRTWESFVRESKIHGWPSFRDEEVNWENVRVLADGECVSVDGTHLGHNLPDGSGNRYCINLVSVAGQPA